MGKPFEETYMGKLRKKVGKQRLFAPSFRAILEDPEGRIVIQKRADNGCWGLPAGNPEEGDSLSDCIRREVDEEVGVRLEDFECFGFASDPKLEICVYPNGDEVHSYCALIYSQNWKGTLKPKDGEATTVKLVHLDEFPEEFLRNELHSVRQYLEFKRDGRFKWG